MLHFYLDFETGALKLLNFVLKGLVSQCVVSSEQVSQSRESESFDVCIFKHFKF